MQSLDWPGDGLNSDSDIMGHTLCSIARANQVMSSLARRRVESR